MANQELSNVSSAHQVESFAIELNDDGHSDILNERPGVTPELTHETHHHKIHKGKGGWKSAGLILVNQGLATLAFFGVGVNLVLFLTRVLRHGNASAANTVSNWTGTVYMFSLVGAFLSDSYWGRYLTCSIFQVIIVMGTVLLSITTSFFLINPPRCGDAFGEVNFYFEDRGLWTVGFLASAGSAILGLVLFLLGTSGYKRYKPCGNPLTRIAQVFVATIKKWKVKVPTDGKMLYELEGSASAIKGSRKIHHSNELRWLDKAATITVKDKNVEKAKQDPWRLCTVTQVEEVKALLKLLPIWMWTIIYSAVFTQMASLFVEQGAVMNTKVGNFHIPAASMSAFDIISVLLCTFIYNELLVPVTGKLTGNPKGLSELQRMGVGLLIGLLAMLAAGFTEIERLRRVNPGEESSSLSIFWQIPQYVLVGASEVFMYVGQLEFFNSQAPDGLKSFGSSLCMASISSGNFVSSFIINIVMGVTAGDSKPGWIPGNLNEGHVDRFFFLLVGLSAVNFICYLLSARWYKYIDVEPEDERNSDMEEQQLDV
ncbi:hypothetical protein C5167_002105 [Papaver somniferum]|uniref:Uncharacterized protein n=1 Tax=Papaver somniferum TaxID=3469 RepID=A0A4Y7L0Z0_PAPSO|nr:hypothetical protein C5167_002105 [Papaver somniferum]